VFRQHPIDRRTHTRFQAIFVDRHLMQKDIQYSVNARMEIKPLGVKWQRHWWTPRPNLYCVLHQGLKPQRKPPMKFRQPQQICMSAIDQSGRWLHWKTAYTLVEPVQHRSQTTNVLREGICFEGLNLLEMHGRRPQRKT
jgi:hypothetical protein